MPSIHTLPHYITVPLVTNLAATAAGGAGVVGGRASSLACLNSCDGGEGVNNVKWVGHLDKL
jgi:hypothetical protein